MASGDSFFGFKNFAKGKINRWEFLDAEPLIKDVRVDQSNLGQSKITIEFDDDQDFFKVINVGEDDAWFARAVNSYGNGFEFHDSYSGLDDFKQGYGVWYILDDDNTELLEKISKFIHPKEFNLEDWSFKEELADKLIKYFPRRIDEIVGDYVMERNNEMNQEASRSVSKEINDYIKSKGFEYIPPDTLKTTVGNIVSMFLQYGVPHVTLKELINTVFKDSEDRIGGWDDNRYDYQNDEYFDKESVNRTINRNLEAIYEKILEDYDSENLGGFLKTIDKVSQKFKLGVTYSLPKDKSVTFKIKDFNFDKQKIGVVLRKGLKQRVLELSEQNFYYLLYQPELFQFGEL